MAEMDMTSMVDVTFLLLIFFMVTASFVIQSAFQTPTQNDGTVTNKELASPIEIRLTQFGEFEVAFGNLQFQPVNSKHELRNELNDIVSTHRGDLSAIVLPNSESEHEDVIEAVDVLTGFKIPFAIKLKS